MSADVNDFASLVDDYLDESVWDPDDITATPSTTDTGYSIDVSAMANGTEYDYTVVITTATRAKNTMKYEVIDTNYNINDLVGIVGDQTIHLSGYISEKKYPENFRLVKYYDAENDEVISFITVK